MKKVFNKIKENALLYLSVAMYVVFIVTAELLATTFFLIPLLFALLGTVIMYIQLKINGNLYDLSDEQIQTITHYKCSEDWLNTYNFAVTLGKD